jgi:hypothetical protein
MAAITPGHFFGDIEVDRMLWRLLRELRDKMQGCCDHKP